MGKISYKIHRAVIAFPDRSGGGAFDQLHAILPVGKSLIQSISQFSQMFRLNRSVYRRAGKIKPTAISRRLFGSSIVHRLFRRYWTGKRNDVTGVRPGLDDQDGGDQIVRYRIAENDGASCAFTFWHTFPPAAAGNLILIMCRLNTTQSVRRRPLAQQESL